MPAITDRSVKQPLLNVTRIGHGTLECVDIAKTRRFYEEVLGFDVIQTSPISLLIRKGFDHTYAVVETRKADKVMDKLNHNGLDLRSDEEVDRAFELLTKVKHEYNIRRLSRPYKQHGVYSFYFMDLDGNWWEVLGTDYAASFRDSSFDLTGRHELDGGKPRELGHTNDPETRARVAGRN
jgi:catechol 2,3-dioxygenase-like lactoylglutathione lyase family enzyme